MKKFNKSLLILIVSVILSITAVPVKVSATSPAFTITISSTESYTDSSPTLPAGVTYTKPASKGIGILTFENDIAIKELTTNEDIGIVINANVEINGYSTAGILANGENKVYLKIGKGGSLTVNGSDGECVFYRGEYPLYSLPFKKYENFDRAYQSDPEQEYSERRGYYFIRSSTINPITLSGPESDDADLTLIPNVSEVTKVKAASGGGTEEDGVYNAVNGFVIVSDAVKSVTYDETTYTYTVNTATSKNYLYLELLFPESEFEKKITYTFLKPGNKDEVITFPDHYDDESSTPDKVIGSAYENGSGGYYVSYYMLLESDDVTDDVYTYHDVSLKLTNGDIVRYINVVSEADHQPVTPTEPEGGGDTEPEGGGNTEPEGGNTNPEGNNNQGSTPENDNSGSSNDETPSVVYKAPDTSVR